MEVRSRTRRALGNLALAIAGCCLGLALCEVVLRVTGLGHPSPLVPYGALPFKRRPNLEFVNRKEIVNRVVLNDWGFHDVDREPSSGSHRILALGDSFVEGLQMPVEALFTSVAERALRRRGHDVEVLNGGVGGTGTAHQYLLYQEFFAPGIEVDQVVLFVFTGNDLLNNHPVLQREVSGNEAEGNVYVDREGSVYVRPVRRSLRQRVLEWADRHSALSYTAHVALFRLKRSRAETRRAAESDSPSEARDAESPEVGRAFDESTRGTLALIRRWHRELDADGIALSIVVLPPAEHLLGRPYGRPENASFVEQLTTLADRVDIPLLAIDLRGMDPADVFTYDGSHYGHFTEEGHRRVGEQVAAWLAEPTFGDAP